MMKIAKNFAMALMVLLMLTGIAMGDVFITELADPNNNANARYIELYNNGASSVNFTDGSGWKINKYTNGSATVSLTLNLTGTINAGGFYVIAYDYANGTYNSVYGLVADQLDAVNNGVAGSNGDDTIELIDGTGAVVDFYGAQPNVDLTGTVWEYEDGRAERALGATTGKNPPADSDWNTWSDGAGGDVIQTKDAPADFDPGEWIGAAASPTITLSTISLTGFTYVIGNGPSTEQSFTAEGSDLTANITITPSDNYEISTGTGGSFVATNPITLTHTGGTVASTTIYVRLKAGLTAGSYNSEAISAASSGATSKSVYCDGAVTGTIPVEPNIGDLYISEVVGDNADGNASNDNGYMEIYNNTSSSIALSNVQARYYNSNPGDPTNTVDLSGYIEPGDYIVLTQNNTGFNAEYSIDADFTGSAFYFNGGDDGADIYHTTNGVLDQFNDNGSAGSPFTWSDANVFERTSIASGSLLTNWTEITTGTGTPGTENDYPLPISLTSFTATAVNGSVALAWETASETNNANFVIYRNDVAIASVAGAGTSTEPHSYSYIDEAVVPGVAYTYVLADVDYANKETKYPGKAVTVTVASDIMVADFVVGAAYPNPFNPTAIVPLELSKDAMVQASVYDLVGREVKTLVNGNVSAGSHELHINGSDMTTGIYLIKVVVDNVADIQKIALMK